MSLRTPDCSTSVPAQEQGALNDLLPVPRGHEAAIVVTLLALFAATLPALSGPCLAQSYTLHIVPRAGPQYEPNDYIYDINDAGFAVGQYGEAPANGNLRGFMYNTTTGNVALVGVAIDITNAGRVFCINQAGIIGGYSTVPGPCNLGALIAPASDPLNFSILAMLPGGTTGIIHGINDLGVAVGYANRVVGCSYPFEISRPCHPCKWVGGVAEQIPSLGGYSGTATSINSTGDIVGFEMFAAGSFEDTRAFMVPSGSTTAIQLPSLSASGSRAFKIKNSGVMVGMSKTAAGGYLAVKWTTPTSLQVLGGLPGFAYSAAMACNADGSICVGTSATGMNFLASNVLVEGGNEGRAVVFAAGRTIDLNTRVSLPPGDFLKSAFAMNSLGWIGGNGRFGDLSLAYVLVPCAPLILDEPMSANQCGSSGTRFSVSPVGTDQVAYGWQIRNDSGSWVPFEGSMIPLGGGGTATATGFSTNRLTVVVQPSPGQTQYLVRASVGNSCGTAYSNPAALTICVADTDDGTGTGACDGGVTIDDLLYYLNIFEQGTLAADVDDGSGTGTPDGGVTIDDLLYYLQRFEAGC